MPGAVSTGLRAEWNESDLSLNLVPRLRMVELYLHSSRAQCIIKCRDKIIFTFTHTYVYINTEPHISTTAGNETLSLPTFDVQKICAG
jgi:hypothetical protein